MVNIREFMRRPKLGTKVAVKAENPDGGATGGGWDVRDAFGSGAALLLWDRRNVVKEGALEEEEEERWIGGDGVRSILEIAIAKAQELN